MLGRTGPLRPRLVSQHHPTSYWDIIGRDTPAKEPPRCGASHGGARQRTECGRACQSRATIRFGLAAASPDPR
jgi:hypothetical protein